MYFKPVKFCENRETFECTARYCISKIRHFNGNKCPLGKRLAAYHYCVRAFETITRWFIAQTIHRSDCMVSSPYAYGWFNVRTIHSSVDRRHIVCVKWLWSSVDEKWRSRMNNWGQRYHWFPERECQSPHRLYYLIVHISQSSHRPYFAVISSPFKLDIWA